MNLGETQNRMCWRWVWEFCRQAESGCRSAEGEVAANSQAKGPNSDDTLERQWGTEEVNPYCISRGEIFQVQKTETHKVYGIAFAVHVYFVRFLFYKILRFSMEVKSRNSADAADKKACAAENPGKRGGIFVEKKKSEAKRS